MEMVEIVLNWIIAPRHATECNSAHLTKTMINGQTIALAKALGPEVVLVGGTVVVMKI
jgi:hypothetical protein